MKDCSWFIEGDIKSYFLSVNHKILMKIIQKKVQDPLIIKSIKTGLKANVFTNNGVYEPEVGTPQGGGILSPLLSNIYLNEFDKYVETLIKEFSTVNSKPRRNPAIDKLYKQGAKNEIYKMRVPYNHPQDTQHVVVRYIRYADDFVIGINGHRKLAVKIKRRIME